MKDIESADELLLRRILDSLASTNKALLYLELGCIPPAHIIKKDELIYRFFQVMIKKPSKCDKIELVQNDLADFNITQSFDEISKLKKKLLKEM